MRRARRFLATAAVLSFGLAAHGETLEYRHCPHHDPPAAAAVEGAHEEHPSAPDGDAHRGPCTCVGTCHASAGAPIASRLAAALIAPAQGRETEPVIPRRVLPRRAAYAIPYPNGPPQAR